LYAIEIGNAIAPPAGRQRVPVELEMAQDSGIGIRGFERRAKNLQSVFAHVV
jgi:hypothetical protein